MFQHFLDLIPILICIGVAIYYGNKEPNGKNE